MSRKEKSGHRTPGYQKKEWAWGYVMIAPVIIGLGVFYIYPFFLTFYNSFLKIGSFNVSSWGGLINYQRLIHDTSMWHTLKNTVRYVIWTIPITLFLALVTAVLLNVKIRGKAVYRVLYFLPYVTMAAAISMVWKWMFNGDFGLINYVLMNLGIITEPIYWNKDADFILPTVMIISVWMSMGNGFPAAACRYLK